MVKQEIDIAVIGGGPAGISACLELAKLSQLKIALFESEPGLGGVPGSSSIIFFGLRHLKRICSGRSYAHKLEKLIKTTLVQIHTNATVLNLIPGGAGEKHRITVASPAGLNSYECRFVLLATGCFEGSRESRRIPGTRPTGILTTGALQKIVNLQHKKPGERAVIIGSELIAFSSLLTLRHAGISIVGMVEEDSEVHTYDSLARTAKSFFRFPIYTDTSVDAIVGTERVEEVRLVTKGSKKRFQLDCDTVIITGKLRPDSSLIFDTPIQQDPLTLGPIVDMNLMTSVPNIFAAGNILHGAEMHDLCALEGKRVAHNIMKSLESIDSEPQANISIQTEPPIRFVVPQKVIPDQIKSYRSSWLSPGFSIQLERKIRNPVIEAWSDHERIWAHSYSRLLGNHRILLPIERFDWNRVSKERGVTLKLKTDKG